jgi:alpha-glucosidase (family GH31 glycosyl hydrolase)
MEVGPTGNHSLWSTAPGGGRGNVDADGYHYEPYYDEALVATWILYANLHNDLADYSLAQARLAHERGTPIARPMIFAFPDHPEYRDLFEQYLYGRDIMVAAIWRAGQTATTVRIPDGSWIDAWTGEEMTPDTVVTVETPEHKIPLYVRKDGAASLGDLGARWQEALKRAKDRPDLAKLAGTVK